MIKQALFSLAVFCALAGRAAVIEGVVLESASGRPLARVRVALVAAAAGATAPAPQYTDRGGRFSFPGLAPGSYLLTAERRGFAMAVYGQKRWDLPGSPIVVEQDSRYVAELRLNRLGAITGLVVDENGVGLPDIAVYAYRDSRPLRLEGQAVTDDRGAFRIAGLKPGRFRLRTGSKQLEDDTGLLPTYLGDSTRPDGAAALEVGLDEEITGVVIRPCPGKLIKLRGRVGFQGVQAVTLYGDVGRKIAAVDSDGRFSFDELVPGPVELMAESSAGWAGYSRLWLAGEMDDEVVLEGAPLPSISLACVSTDGEKMGKDSAVLRLSRTIPAEEPRFVQLACGETASLGAGLWEITAAAAPGWKVSEFRLNERPLNLTTFEALPGQKFTLTLVQSREGQ